MISANDRADELAAMARRLIDLVAAETAALRAHQLAPPGDLAEKDRLAHAWRIEVGRLKQDPGALAGADPERRATLKSLAAELAASLDQHAQALLAMKTVSEGLVRAIAEETGRARRPPAAYTAGGDLGAARGPAASGMAVNAKV
jgi:hypothetical protein